VGKHTTTLNALESKVNIINAKIQDLQSKTSSIEVSLAKIANTQAMLLIMMAGKPESNPTANLKFISSIKRVVLSIREIVDDMVIYRDFDKPIREVEDDFF
jgi:hypothetical protein